MVSKNKKDQCLLTKNEPSTIFKTAFDKDSKLSVNNFSKEINSPIISHEEKKNTNAADPENTNEIILINKSLESQSIELITPYKQDISKKSKTTRKKDSTLKKAKNIWENTVGMNQNEKTIKREERKQIHRDSMSLSQSKHEETNNSYHERKILESSFSTSVKEKSKRRERESLFISTSQQEDSLRSEQSEMEEGKFSALVNILSSRDITTLSRIELDKKIIGETLLQLEMTGIIKITRSRSNKNKVRATLKGPYTGLKRPSLTIHMHDHDLPWEKQKRVKDHFFNFLDECGIVIYDIMQQFDDEAADAGEG